MACRATSALFRLVEAPSLATQPAASRFPLPHDKKKRKAALLDFVNPRKFATFFSEISNMFLSYYSINNSIVVKSLTFCLRIWYE